WEFISVRFKPKTPFNLTLQYANGTYHFFWKSGYETHTYRAALIFMYEFKYYKDGDPTRHVLYKEMIQIEEMRLDPDTMYAVMVKSKVDDRQVYGGTWSDWSSTVKWKTAYRDEPREVSKIAIGMFAMVGLLILLVSIPAAGKVKCTYKEQLGGPICDLLGQLATKKSLSEWQCLSEIKMGRGSPIPPMLWRKIVEQYQKGVSQRKIAKSLKLSSPTVHDIIQRFRESGTISVRKGQGRKTILDARDLRALRRHCITYRNATVMEITTWAQEYFQKTLSVNTIHRAIRRCRLKLYRSKKKPYLNMIQKRRRFLWAKVHLKWTVAKWKTVLWSDESKFEVLFGKLGRHVIRTKEDKDNPSCY
uniref:Paired domain-containing protein n=1 Tax=Cyprinus carpio TaxID=7962 RepID=A0A8C2CAS5_CYPCA